MTFLYRRLSDAFIWSTYSHCTLHDHGRIRRNSESTAAVVDAKAIIATATLNERWFKAFKTIDSNGDGAIDKLELKVFIRWLGALTNGSHVSALRMCNVCWQW